MIVQLERNLHFRTRYPKQVSTIVLNPTSAPLLQNYFLPTLFFYPIAILEHDNQLSRFPEHPWHVNHPVLTACLLYSVNYYFAIELLLPLLHTMTNTRGARTKPAPQEDIENETLDRETDNSQPVSSQRVRLPSARQREILADCDMNASSSPSRTRAVKPKLNAAKSKTKPKKLPPKTIPKSKSLSQKKYFEDDEEDSEAEERRLTFEKEVEEKRRAARELLMERLNRQQERDNEEDRVAAEFEADKSMF